MWHLNISFFFFLFFFLFSKNRAWHFLRQLFRKYQNIFFFLQTIRNIINLLKVGEFSRVLPANIIRRVSFKIVTGDIQKFFFFFFFYVSQTIGLVISIHMKFRIFSPDKRFKWNVKPYFLEKRITNIWARHCCSCGWRTELKTMLSIECPHGCFKSLKNYTHIRANV